MLPESLIVADGDADTRKMFTRILSRYDIHVHEASRAPDLVTVLQLLKPDTIIMSMQLPGIVSGFEFVRIIRLSSAYHLRIIALTTDPGTERHPDHHLLDALLLKPFSFPELMPQLLAPQSAMSWSHHAPFDLRS